MPIRILFVFVMLWFDDDDELILILLLILWEDYGGFNKFHFYLIIFKGLLYSLSPLSLSERMSAHVYSCEWKRPQTSVNGVGSPGVGVTDSCEPLSMGAGDWMQLLYKSSEHS